MDGVAYDIIHRLLFYIIIHKISIAVFKKFQY